MANQDQHAFDDQQDFDEFDALVDESSDTMLEDDYGYEDSHHGRKKRSSALFIVVLLVLAAGGGASWFLFFRGSDSVSALPAPAVAESRQQPAYDGMNPDHAAAQDAALPPMVQDQHNTQQEDGLPPLAAEQSTGNGQQDGFPPLDENQAQIPQPVDGMLAEALPPPAAQMPFEQAISEQQTNGHMPSVPAPDSPDQMLHASQESVAPEMAPIAETQVPPVAQTHSNVDLAQIRQEMQQQLDQRLNEVAAQMQQQIQNLSTDIQNLRQSAPATGTEQPTLSAGELSALNEKLDRLAQQVDALDQRTTTFATELQKRADSPQEPAIRTTATPVARAPAATTPVPASRRPAAAGNAKRAPASTVNGWELRSAQPGVAWLGRRGANEMGRYAVGQHVPGLGTVQAVTQENGRWVVRTSGGILRQ